MVASYDNNYFNNLEYNEKVKLNPEYIYNLFNDAQQIYNVDHP